MYRFVLILWLVFLVTLSMLPLGIKNQIGTTGHLHNIGHVLAFTITGMLLTWKAESSFLRLMLACVALLIGFGLELLEHAVYKDLFEWSDVLLDAIGTLIALAIVLFRPAATARAR